MAKSKTLIMTVGLPRSGKSTWARQQGIPIVNPDSIRLALHGQAWRREAEPIVWAIAKLMVRSLFHAGHDRVILDSCAHTKYRRKEWEDQEWALKLEWFDTPKDVCIARALENKQEYLVPIIQRFAREMETN